MPLVLDRYPNVAEDRFQTEAKAAGWHPSKRGWPDFWMIRDGVRCAVEVKPDPSAELSYEQESVMMWLASHGIPCFRWDPETGFTPLGSERIARLKSRT
jgi:hypothetical protein